MAGKGVAFLGTFLRVVALFGGTGGRERKVAAIGGKFGRGRCGGDSSWKRKREEEDREEERDRERRR